MTLKEALARVAELEADLDLIEQFLVTHLEEGAERPSCFFCHAEPLAFVHPHERAAGQIVCRCPNCAATPAAWAKALSRKMLDGSLADCDNGKPQ